jgi:hypothetical protein
VELRLKPFFDQHLSHRRAELRHQHATLYKNLTGRRRQLSTNLRELDVVEIGLNTLTH